MSSNTESFRNHPRERERISRFFQLVPASGKTALDIGTRDGHLARLLAERFERVVALDLSLPQIDHPGIECIAGDATRLPFEDASFDTVICAEVLEHIPTALMPAACREIARVTGGAAIIGVPNRQDLRLHRTTCRTCGKINPPWGHVNSFSAPGLTSLLAGLTPVKTDYVGTTREASNGLSAALMDYAGNPFGTYDQDEPCIHCGAALLPPAGRSHLQRVATRLAHWGIQLQQSKASPRGNWLHMRFEKTPSVNPAS